MRADYSARRAVQPSNGVARGLRPVARRHEPVSVSDWSTLGAHEREVALVRASLLMSHRQDTPTHRRWS